MSRVGVVMEPLYLSRPRFISMRFTTGDARPSGGSPTRESQGSGNEHAGAGEHLLLPARDRPRDLARALLELACYVRHFAVTPVLSIGRGFRPSAQEDHPLKGKLSK